MTVLVFTNYTFVVCCQCEDSGTELDTTGLFCLAPIVLSKINWRSQRGFAAGGQPSLQRKYFIPDSRQGAFKDVCWTMLPSCCPLKVTGLAF